MQEQESGRYGKLLQPGGDLMQVKSTIKLNMPRISQLTRAAVVALEQTAEALHTEVVQAQVMPFDTGNLQNESTFVDTSEASNGKVSLVSSTPYARRLYYHPEYQFQKYENPFAGGKWFEPWLPGGVSSGFCREAFKKFYKKAGGV
jgi:hypothetical protein